MRRVGRLGALARRCGTEGKGEAVGRAVRVGVSFVAAALSAVVAWAALVLLSALGTFVPVEQAFGAVLLAGSLGGILAWGVAGVRAWRGTGEALGARSSSGRRGGGER
jgi:hypothetical protein